MPQGLATVPGRAASEKRHLSMKAASETGHQGLEASKWESKLGVFWCVLSPRLSTVDLKLGFALELQGSAERANPLRVPS